MDIVAEFASLMDLVATVWVTKRQRGARGRSADDDYDPSVYFADMIDFKIRQEGRRVGQLELVRKLLALRFGALPPHTLERLEQAGLDELESIAIRLLSAATLDDALGEQQE